MGLELECFELPEYNDGRIFDWKEKNDSVMLDDYLILNRYGNFWEVHYKIGQEDWEVLSTGTKEFCKKTVEHEIRKSENDRASIK